MTTETPKNACLLCGHKFEAASTPDGAALIAKPGDLAVCIQGLFEIARGPEAVRHWIEGFN